MSHPLTASLLSASLLASITIAPDARAQEGAPARAGRAPRTATTATGQHPYVVLSAVTADDDFDAAAQHLAAHHQAPILRFTPDKLADIAQDLRSAQPRHVALVMRPEQIDFAFQRELLQLAANIDQDPFVDFAFGYITGATADTALALAKRGTDRNAKKGKLRFGEVAGGLDKSQLNKWPAWLGATQVDSLRVYCAGEKSFPEAGRDREFLRKNLPDIEGRDVVTFIGHGYPHEVHGGPDYSDIKGLNLDGAVALNVACYTGTTDRWFEGNYNTRSMVEKHVPIEESFCLNVLESGVVGYTAYLCPRPAGPELDTDRSALVFGGLSLGDARRRDYDKTVLGYLGFGEDGLDLAPVSDGAKMPASRDPVRDIMLEGATGGVVFGDPACTPFAATPSKSPVQVRLTPTKKGIQVKATVAANVLFTHCGDQTARWGSSMAMKVYVRIPLEERHVTDFVVERLRIGKTDVTSRVIWAMEEDHGERFLHAKVNFERSIKRVSKLQLDARVVTTNDASLGKQRGGEVQKPQRGGGSPGMAPAKGDPFALGKKRGASRKAVEAAIEANKMMLKGMSYSALSDFGKLGEEGFQAALALIECGRGNSRTWLLLKATHRPGLEQKLIALASGPALPQYGMWSVLRGLGIADTPAVRTYIKQRLATDQDAGTWMSTAEAAGTLGAKEFANTIGDRVLEFRSAWSGVEPNLLQALAAIGGADAIAKLEAIAAHPKCTNWKRAHAMLQRLDAKAAERAKAKRGKAKSQKSSR
ncbi:MAG: hypothetical protein AB8H80_06460 [Planctomycetota bacterium]